LCTPGMGMNLWGESPCTRTKRCSYDEYYQKYEPKARAIL
jgi:hypothetical protein